LKENEKYLIINYGIEEKLSEPPDFITESELIDEMEAYNIGTCGTIPSHINNLSLRGYVKVENNRIIPTKLGIA
jgi:DNA topoisomerase-3